MDEGWISLVRNESVLVIVVLFLLGLVQSVIPGFVCSESTRPVSYNGQLASG